MIWLDYNVESYPDGSFTIKGDWPGEVMGRKKDGSWGGKQDPLYKPGDVFVVNEYGILRKSDDLSVLLMKYQLRKETTKVE